MAGLGNLSFDIKRRNLQYMNSGYYFSASATPLKTQDYRVFKVPVGSPGQGYPDDLTDAQTTAQVVDGLAKDQAMRITGIGIEILYSQYVNAIPDGAIRQVVHDFMANTTLFYRIGLEYTPIGNLNQLPCGYGVIDSDISMAAAGNLSYYRAQNGLPSIEAVIMREVEIIWIGGSNVGWIFKLSKDGIVLDIDLEVRLALFGVVGNDIATITGMSPEQIEAIQEAS